MEKEKKKFNQEAYDKYVEMEYTALRTGTKNKGKAYEELKKIVFANDGKKALTTNTYKVGHISVYLIEGLAVSQKTLSLFSKSAQKMLFS